MKFYGKIGFWCDDAETSPGIYNGVIIERPYFGDVLKNNRRWQNTGNQNDSLTTNNQISILSDLYFQQNWTSIKYVIWNGVKLKVSNVDLEGYPRVILDLGGEYHGENETRIRQASSSNTGE